MLPRLCSGVALTGLHRPSITWTHTDDATEQTREGGGPLRDVYPSQQIVAIKIKSTTKGPSTPKRPPNKGGPLCGVCVLQLRDCIGALTGSGTT